MRKLLVFVLLSCSLVVLVAGAPGCGAGASCESVCTEQKSKGCVTNPKDCAKFCADESTIASAAGCAAALTDAVDCTIALADVCVSDSCATKYNALTSCTASYCAKSAATCAVLNTD